MAGLLGSALAGALMGGGQAVQHNAQSRIEQRRQEALADIKHRYRMEQQDDQQQFTRGENQRDREFQRGERIAGQEFTAGENQADRQLSRWQTGVQQAGADRRATADWQLVPLEGGGYGRYNPSTNQYEEANLPEGVRMSGSLNGELSDRDKYQLDGLADRMEAIRTRISDEMREPTPEEKAELGRLQGQYDAMLGGGGAQTPLQQLMAGEGGGVDGAETGSQDGDGGGTQASDTSARGIIARQRDQQAGYLEQRDAQAAAETAKDEADAVIDEIYRERTGGYSSPVMQDQFLEQNGGTAEVSEETIARAQAAADQLLEASRSEHVSEDERRWIADRIMQLQDLGVPIALDDQ